MARVAVTGAAGFIGSHLLPALLSENHEVRGLVRPGTPRSLPAGVNRVPGDVRSLEAMRSLVADSDVVVHLAASFRAEDATEDIITSGTANLLAAARDTGVKRLIHVGCMGEEAASHFPFYRAKWKAEKLVADSDLPHVILRPSLIVGRGDGVTRQLADVVRSLPVVPVPGRGEQRTQPVLVDDFVRCVIAALDSADLENQTADVGGPMFITFSQLVDLIAGEIGVQKPKALLPYRVLGTIAPLVPASGRRFYASPRLALFGQGVVSSPGVVARLFGFQAQSILPHISALVD